MNSALPRLAFRRAKETDDLSRLVELRDEAARWQISRGIAQWRPGELDEAHFLERIKKGEVWLAVVQRMEPAVGAWEIWWEDRYTWGEQPPVAGYLHRLMIDRTVVPPGTGRLLLDAAERRIATCGRHIVRFECASNNPRLRRYYAEAGYGEVGHCPVSRPSGYPVTLFEKHLSAVR
jgi:ribosomal protein S18 acetylase RimI-like enzyme